MFFYNNPSQLSWTSFLDLFKPHLLHITHNPKSMAVQSGISSHVIFPQEEQQKDPYSAT